ncbi:hypothetical protein WG66_012583 [Moniliophthora roreri]|nr:hypothetical protein WG66_012583 [Moniliophthora roreri]
MGQRHQVFLIARLIPHSDSKSSDGNKSQPFYRCITAHHNQWCYGRLPLSGSRRFLNLLKIPDNIEILRDELRRAQGKYGRQGKAPHVHALGFPYAHYLLAQAWDTDLDNPDSAYASGVGLENAVVGPNEGCFDHGNDDGITVFDVTDPMNPAFCHIIGNEPLTPEQYVRGYYRVPSKERMTVLEDDSDYVKKEKQRTAFVEEDVLGHISSLEGVRLLSRDVLAEVWPEEFLGGKAPRAEVLEKEPMSETAALPPLADLTIGPSVDRCLLQNDWSGLEPFFEMPGKAERIKEALFSKNPFPDAGITPLTKMLPYELKKNNGILEIVGPQFTVEQILSIMSALPADAVQAVKLNGQQSLVPKLIVDLATTFPNLSRIDLLNTNITDEQLLEICSKQPEALYKLHTIVHPALLVRTPTKPNLPIPQNTEEVQALAHQLSIAPEGFIFQQYRPGNYRNLTTASIPFFHPENVLNGLARFFTFLKNGDDFFPHAYGECQLVQPMVLSCIPSTSPVHTSTTATNKTFEDRQRWLHRTVTCVPMSGPHDPFMARGWLFLINSSFRMFGEPDPKYGFVKVDEQAHKEWLVELLTAQLEDRSADEDSAMRPRRVDRDGGVMEFYRPQSYFPFKLPHPRVSALPSDAWKVYDVRGFADAVAREGRPRPSEEAIAAFEGAIAPTAMNETKEQRERFSPPLVFRLMDGDDVKAFIPAAYPYRL